jgi:hypothetical protein
VKSIKTIKCEYGVRKHKSGWKPLSSEQLNPLFKGYNLAITVVDVDSVRARNIENNEIGWTFGWMRTKATVVPKLNT